MELNYLLIWFVGISCLSGALRHRAQGPDFASWSRLQFLILLLLAIGIELFPEHAGHVAFGIWLLLIVIPGRLVRRLQQALVSRNMQQAKINAQLVALFHPFRPWNSILPVIEEIEAIQQGSAAPPLPVTEADRLFVMRLVQRAQQAAVLQSYDQATNRQASVTFALLTVNVVVFVLGLLNPDLEESMFIQGAVIPELVVRYGEWWRLLTGCFLHAGFLHLLMNTLALRFLAPPIEVIFGHFRFLLIYLLSGVGAMGLVVTLTQVGWVANHPIIGASGALMGMVGATAACYIADWFSGQRQQARRQLVSIGMVILIQASFDLSTPNVSFTAHMSGLLIGGLIAGLLLLRSSRYSLR